MKIYTMLSTEINQNQLQLLCNSKLDLEKYFDNYNRTCGGRKRKLNLSQIIEILTLKNTCSCENWLGLFNSIKLIKSDWILPCYSNFLKTIKLSMEFLLKQIQNILVINNLEFLNRDDKVVYVDSSSLPVCKVIRSKRHKTMKDVANYSKSTTGWYYGLKLHATIDYHTQHLLNFQVGNSNIDDRDYLKYIATTKYKNQGIYFVADKGYLGKECLKLIQDSGNYLLTGVKSSNKQTGILAKFQTYLIYNRAKIETLFSNLKCNLFMTQTRSRSKLGYYFMYIQSLFSLLSTKKS